MGTPDSQGHSLLAGSTYTYRKLHFSRPHFQAEDLILHDQGCTDLLIFETGDRYIRISEQDHGCGTLAWRFVKALAILLRSRVPLGHFQMNVDRLTRHRSESSERLHLDHPPSCSSKVKALTQCVWIDRPRQVVGALISIHTTRGCCHSTELQVCIRASRRAPGREHLAITIVAPRDPPQCSSSAAAAPRQSRNGSTWASRIATLRVAFRDSHHTDGLLWGARVSAVHRATQRCYHRTRYGAQYAVPY